MDTLYENHLYIFSYYRLVYLSQKQMPELCFLLIYNFRSGDGHPGLDPGPLRKLEKPHK